MDDVEEVEVAEGGAVEIPDFDFDEALAELKATAFDGRELIGLSKAAMKIVSAWPHVRRWSVPEPMGDKRLHITWHYINWDMTELAILADVSDRAAWNIFTKLAKQNIIYPDGTYPQQVADYLKLEVDSLMGRDEEE